VFIADIVLKQMPEYSVRRLGLEMLMPAFRTRQMFMSNFSDGCPHWPQHPVCVEKSIAVAEAARCS
jgi:hypothetical protein